MSHSMRVLLVDDELTFLEYTARFLRQHGLECDTSANAADCLKLLEANSYNVAVCDLIMPDNSSSELIKEIGRRVPGLPVIVITAHPTVETAVDSVNLAVFSYLLKPIDPLDLLREIRAAASRFELISATQAVEERLNSWLSSLNSVRESLRDHAAKRSPLPVETFVTLSVRNIVAALADLNHFINTLLRRVDNPYTCGLMDCPRLNQHLELIRYTVKVLDSTKRSFKSKELGELRKKLEQYLDGDEGSEP